MRYIISLILLLLLTVTAMAKEIQTEIVIKASREKVWSILTDFDNFPNWNPFITSLTGEVKVGNKIKVRIEPPESKAMTFKPKVLTLETNKQLRWRGRLLFPGLFDGSHKFELIDNGNGTTTFRQSEKFSGLFVPFFNPSKTKKGFEAMNQKLKELAEQ